jgi:hypothetical protein
MADWAVLSTQQLSGRNDTRVNLGIGANIAGTEANIGLNYFSNQSFNRRQQYYLWRYADNNRRFLKQISAGRIAHNATSSIYSPVAGIQFTNASTGLRRSFGSYRITDVTQPGWIVEAYVNNVMVDYTKADASGFFSFDIPLVYGNTVVRLQFYGPFGEEYSTLKNVHIPFNFLPESEFEYTITAAVIEGSKSSYFSKAGFNYGISQRITVGAGGEYLSSVHSGQFMPYASASIRLSSNLLASTEYTHGVRAKATINYKLKSNAMFEGLFIKYVKGQAAIVFNYLEERRAVVTIPYRLGSVSGLSRIQVNQVLLPSQRYYTNTEWLLSAGIKRVSINLNNVLVSSPRAENNSHNYFVYSDLSLAARLTSRLALIPQAQYDYKTGRFIAVKSRLEYFANRRAHLNMAFEKNFTSSITSTTIGFRYDLSYARIGTVVREFNSEYAITGYVRGSFIADNKTKFFSPNIRGSLRTGAVTLSAYLDLNRNGIREDDEPKIDGLRAEVRGGQVQYDNSDSLVRILHLEPYTNYYVDLSKNNFRNITWEAAYKSINIKSIPNQMQLIEIPVFSRCEVAGKVSVDDHRLPDGVTDLEVCFYNKAGDLKACTTVESDGSFAYNDLIPGEYSATISLSKHDAERFYTNPASLSFSIDINKNDGFVTDLHFRLMSKSL